MWRGNGPAPGGALPVCWSIVIAISTFPTSTTGCEAILDAASAAGVGRIVTISTYVSRYDTYRQLAEAHDSVFFTIGTHPHNAGSEPDVAAEKLVALAQHPRCIAIGEAGLDYHYDKSPRDVQRKVFRTHIAASRTSGLPLIIHARNADDDMIDILSDEMGRGRFDAVLHCFSSGARLAEVGVDLGLYVSFSGILTFKKFRRYPPRLPRPFHMIGCWWRPMRPTSPRCPYRGQDERAGLCRADTARVLAEVVGVPKVRSR